jgi:hypothetical protein
MKKYTLIILFLFLFGYAQAKSVVREGEPSITFNKLYIPATLKQGQLYKISAEITIQKNIWQDLGVFLHITNPTDNKILINNNFSPSLPSSQWVPGEIVRLGPVNGYIPADFTPGTYNIQMGLFLTKATPEEILYIREPYTNKEMKDFVVGKITVEPAKPEEFKKREDLVISDFETLVDLKKWQPRDCLIEQDSDNAVERKYAAKVIYLKNKGCCPSVILDNFFRYSDPKYSDWSVYDILQFQIYGTKDKEGRTYLNYPVNIQIKDKAERRYQWPIPVTQSRDGPMSIVLSQIGKVVDLTDIGNLSFFVGSTPTDQDWIVYLDDIRLISLGLEREKEPFVKFEGIKISKDKIKPNEEIEIESSFSISNRFVEDYGLYIHIYRSIDKAGWINADVFPSPATTFWEINKVITQGPFRIYIPPETPPGKYSIEMGLFLAKQIPSGSDYIKYHRGKDEVYYIEQPNAPLDYFKQPYVNYKEYGDWVVGSFEVVAP